MAASHPIRPPRSFARTTLVVGLLVAMCGGGSAWWNVGHSRLDQTWVSVPATGMAQLQSMRRGWSIASGRLMWFKEEFISAVVPQGTAEDNPATSRSEWTIAPASSGRHHASLPRWFLSDWREWRLGSLGWYTTTGGGISSRVVSVPLWLPAMLLCAPSVLSWYRRRATSRRLSAGACWSCEQPHVGSLAGTRCPECGAERPT